MKLGRIVRSSPDGEQIRLVVVEPDQGRVVDLALAWSLVARRRGATPEAARRLSAALFPASMAAAIAAGPTFLEAADASRAAADDASLPIEEVTWASAVDPPVIRDCLTFPLHMQQFHAAVGVGSPNPQVFKTPPFFKGSTGTVYGHDAEIPYPSFTDYLDYELEIGIVIGSAGHNLTPEQAPIFGMTIFNDFSARDIQSAEMGMGMGPQKSKDFAYGIGPWITTIDELPELSAMRGSIHVNGELWSSCTADGMIFSPAELVAWVSVSDNLQPGDVIASGTLGNGSGLELGRKLQSGDVLDLQLDGVGVLRTRIGGVETAPWRPQEKPFPWAQPVADKVGA